MGRHTETRRILLIDGKEDWLAFARDALSSAGYAVDTASTAAQGQARLREQRADLVLVDLKEAEQSSQVVRDMAGSRSPARCHVVVLFPTDLTIEKMRTMFKLGVYDCVTKQYDPDRLRALVNDQVAEIASQSPTQEEAGDYG